MDMAKKVNESFDKSNVGTPDEVGTPTKESKRSGTVKAISLLAVVITATTGSMVVVSNQRPAPEAVRIASTPPAVAADLFSTLAAQVTYAHLSPVSATRIYAYSFLAADLAASSGSEALRTTSAAAIAGASVAKHMFDQPTPNGEFDAMIRRHASTTTPEVVTHAKEVANRVIELTDKDGYAALPFAWSEQEGTTSYRWEPTGNGDGGSEPNWGEMKPLISGSIDCTAPSPSDEEVLKEGRSMYKTFTVKAALGNDVMWWLAGESTPTPAGQWMRMAVAAYGADGLKPLEVLKNMSRIAVAEYDASIVGWAEKYRHSLARPETLWKKLYPDAPHLLPRDTPAHPSYPSGHSLFSAAASTILISTRGDLPLADALGVDLAAPVETRSWPTTTAALKEASQSRVNAGFHYPMDTVAGELIGTCVATGVLTEYDKLVEGLSK